MTYKAKKIVIITEKVILEELTDLIENCGATGYTVYSAGGKGSRGMRASSRDSVTDAFANVKVEVITGDSNLASDIADKITDTYFANYSGIIYLEDVEILRPQKFHKSGTDKFS